MGFVMSPKKDNEVEDCEKVECEGENEKKELNLRPHEGSLTAKLIINNKYSY